MQRAVAISRLVRSFKVLRRVDSDDVLDGAPADGTGHSCRVEDGGVVEAETEVVAGGDQGVGLVFPADGAEATLAGGRWLGWGGLRSKGGGDLGGGGGGWGG